MNENVKKGLIITIILILMAGIAFLIYWGVTNYEKVQEGLKGTGIYTAQDLENAKKEGYQEGANSLQELEKQLQDLKAQLDTKTKSVTELTNRVTELTNANNELLENKSENEQIINSLRTEVYNLRQSKEQLEIQVNSLTKSLEQANSTIDNNNIELENYQIQVENLQNSVNDLNSKIQRLQTLLEESNIDFENMVFATFMLDNTVWATQIYEKNSTVNISSTPVKPYYDFIGWTINGIDLVDFEELRIVEDTIFIAKFTLSDSVFVFSGLDQEGNITTNEQDIIEYMIGTGLSNNGMGGVQRQDIYRGENITKIEIPNSHNGKPVTIIGDSSFELVTEIEEVILPDTIKIIGQFAFYGCNNLEKINFPNSLIEIHKDAFSKATKLENVILPESLTTLWNEAFAFCSSLSNLKLNCQIESIPRGCFYGCANLETVELPITVKTIGIEAFRNCTNLYKVVFNEGLESIDSLAFYNCARMGYFDFPSTLTSIGSNCFSAVRGGVDIVIRRTEFFGGFLENFSSTLYLTKESNKLYVLESLITVYSGSNFKKYFSNFIEISELDSSVDPWYFNKEF